MSASDDKSKKIPLPPKKIVKPVQIPKRAMTFNAHVPRQNRQHHRPGK